MNSVALTTTNINDQMMRPYDLGRLDADDNNICCPEEYYGRRSQKAQYCLGYISINPSPSAIDALRMFSPEMQVA